MNFKLTSILKFLVLVIMAFASLCKSDKYRIQIGQGVNDCGIVGPKKAITYDIEGTEKILSVEKVTMFENKQKTDHGIIEGNKLKSFMGSLENLHELPKFKQLAPYDVYGMDTNILVLKNDKLYWAYGFNPDCIDSEKQESPIQISTMQQEGYKSNINGMIDSISF